MIPGDAVEVECVVTHPPGYRALLAGGTGLVSLALDAEIHDVVPADGAVVHDYIPGPQSYSVPFFHLKSFLFLLQMYTEIKTESSLYSYKPFQKSQQPPHCRYPHP